MSTTQFPTVPAAPKVGWLLRSICAGIAITLIALWGLAANLVPSTSGMGTHQQLGLPPCSARVLYGVPCPACGMTTSWAFLTRGEFLAACQANIGGVAFGLLTVGLIPVTAWTAVRGYRYQDRTLWTIVIGLSAAMLLATAQWGFRLLTE